MAGNRKPPKSARAAFRSGATTGAMTGNLSQKTKSQRTSKVVSSAGRQKATVVVKKKGRK